MKEKKFNDKKIPLPEPFRAAAYFKEGGYIASSSQGFRHSLFHAPESYTRLPDTPATKEGKENLLSRKPYSSEEVRIKKRL